MRLGKGSSPGLSTNFASCKLLVRILAFALMCLTITGELGGAQAATPKVPAWGLSVDGSPSTLPVGVGHHGRFVAIVENIGNVITEPGAILRDVLPPGLTVRQAEANGCHSEKPNEVECPLPELAPTKFSAIYIEFEETSLPVAGTTFQNKVEIDGGGAQATSFENLLHVQSSNESGPAPAGLEYFSLRATGPAGEAATQASGHPSLFTTSVFFKSQNAETVSGSVRPVEPVKDLVFYLPLGVLGNAIVASQCPSTLVETGPELTGCPPGSKLGTILPLVVSAGFAVEHGIYNITPEHGYAAEFAFTSNGFTFVSYANVVRRDGAYMVRVSTPGIPAASALIGFVASFYGDIEESFVVNETETTLDRGAFLTDPSDCAELTQARDGSIAFNTWKNPDPSLQFTGSSLVFPSLTGCENLSLSAKLAISPETTQSDAPSAIEAALEIPQAPNDASGLATPPVKSTVVALPSGMSVSPSSANGLGACPATGPDGVDIEGQGSQEVAADGLERPAHGHCPRSSQIGSVRARTPLLREELTGRMFLATPRCGTSNEPACTIEDAEDGRLIGLYLELEAPNAGIVVKLSGHAMLTSGTGQVTASFEEIPQFPISNVVVTTKQGPRAPLETSQSCGLSTSSAKVTSWSPDTPPTESASSFLVDWNGEGQSCPTTYPFSPFFNATTTVPQVASTSPFTLMLGREDREQDIRSISNTLPEGMLANIAKASRCPEPQASASSLQACPAASQIGTVTVAVGPGPNPYYVTGKVFFAGAYGGAPFSLSIVVPAVAGPFNLGDVLVRVKLFVDPHTTQATAVSDPLPQELDGVPLRMRSLNVVLFDSEFVLNPTSCAPSNIAGTVTSTTGTRTNLSSPFTATGCDTLPFRPKFDITTEARATKVGGTGVDVKIAYPQGRQANIAKLVIGFPKQVPARAATLRRACLATTFEANPAACPSASNVGSAIVHTPILAQPLTGPIYLVSYGNAKFPDAVSVLQGEGITVDVVGESFISKNGALRATFAAVPDAPFSSLHAVLPPGPDSLFTSVRSTGKAQGSQCGENLVVPVSMVAHDGSSISKNAEMKIMGCRPLVSIKHVQIGTHNLVVTVTTSVRGNLRLGGSGLRTLKRGNLRPGLHKMTIALTRPGVALALAHRKGLLIVKLVVGKQMTKASSETTL